MWLRLLIIFLSIGLLSILQTSFLVHFNIAGAMLNLVFILFFLIVFFSAQGETSPLLGGEDLFSAIIAGFFLDIFSSSYFGGAIILLLIIVFVFKYLFAMLKKTKDKYPIVYFAPLFILFFIIFNLPQMISHFNWIFLIEIVYNLVFAICGFYIYKRLKLYEFGK